MAKLIANMSLSPQVPLAFFSLQLGRVQVLGLGYVLTRKYPIASRYPLEAGRAGS